MARNMNACNRPAFPAPITFRQCFGSLFPSRPGIAVRRTASLPLAYDPPARPKPLRRGEGPAIHVFAADKESKAWITATSAVMTPSLWKQSGLLRRWRSSQGRGPLGYFVDQHLVGDPAQRGLFLDRPDRALLQDRRYGRLLDHAAGRMNRSRGREPLNPRRDVDGLAEIILALVEHHREARPLVNADLDHEILGAALGIEVIHGGAHSQTR